MRWLFRIAIVLVLALSASLVGLLMLPQERIARLAAEQVRIQTGRTLEIGGEVGLSVWPVLGVRTGPVRLSNVDWAGSEPMLTADSLSIGVSAPALLAGNIRVTEIVAHRPVMRLARHEDGRANWEFSQIAATSTETAQAASGASRDITLERLQLTDASLHFAAPGIAPLAVSDLDLDMRWPRRDAPADLTARAVLGGDPISGEFRVEGFDAYLGGDASQVRGRLVTEGGTITFAGLANLDGEIAGRLRVQARNTAQMARDLGAEIAAPPEGFGRSVDLAGEVTYTTDRRLSLRDMTLDLDGNAMSGAADIQFGGVPRIIAQLEAGVLDFSALGGRSDGASDDDTAAAQDGWPRDPIDARLLALFNGSVSLRAQRITTPSAEFGRTRAVLRLDQARAVLELLNVQVFGGTIYGQLVANNRSGLSIGGKLRASEFQIAQALTRLADIDKLNGRAAGAIEFLGVGESVHDIMNSLKGQGELSMAQGTLDGLDLDKLLRLGDGAAGTGGTTVFDSLAATFTIDQGDLLNDDLLVMLTGFRAEGSGRIGLGARDIDYLFSPVVLQTDETKELVIPIRITGPWSNPSIRPDLESALQAKASVRLDEIEDAAKETVQQKISEELGVTAEDGQGIEDALKDKVDGEVKRGLQRLLNLD